MSPVDQFVANLRAAFGREGVEIIETHISWVFLAGEWAYKVKKPVRYDFLDFSTLEKRRHFCEEELRLNRRFAPELYEGVVAIREGEEGFALGGGGTPVEFAVKMRRFPQEALLSALAERGELTAEMIDATAVAVARMHDGAERAGVDGRFGRPEDIAFWVGDNFSELRPRLTGAERREALGGIEAWCRTQDGPLAPVLEKRLADGFVRECHGDLHLRNIAWLDGRPVFFDCIEFNESFRRIDVMSETAFVVMDLEDRGFVAMAHRFLNQYLAAGGDYAGLEVLRYYLVYRAMVRAKVATLREEEGGLSADEDAALWASYDTYVALARRFAQGERPVMVILHGLAGAGKSTVATALVEAMGAVQVRSDVERKRLFGMEAGMRSGSAVEGSIYSAAAGEATYARLAECSASIVGAGWTAVVDATFLKRAERERVRKLGARLEVPVVIVEVTAPAEVLEERVRRREAEGVDPSEAGVEVLHRQMETCKALAGWERERCVVVDSTQPFDVESLVRRIRAK